MIELKIEDHKYKIPQGWSDITLQRLIELESVRANYEGDELVLRVVECLTGMPIAVQERLKVTSMQRILEHLSFQNDLPQGITQSFEVAGVKYFGPEDLENISFEAFTYCMHHHKHAAEKGRKYALIPYIASALFFREDESFEDLRGEKRKARAEAFKQMSAADAIGIGNFFLILSAVCQTDTRQSLRRQMAAAMDTTLAELKPLSASTAGTTSLQTLLGTLMNSILSLRNRLAAYSSGSTGARTSEASNALKTKTNEAHRK